MALERYKRVSEKAAERMAPVPEEDIARKEKEKLRTPWTWKRVFKALGLRCLKLIFAVLVLFAVSALVNSLNSGV